MTHFIYQESTLEDLKLSELKEIGASVGVRPADARLKSAWIECILYAQSKLVKVAESSNSQNELASYIIEKTTCATTMPEFVDYERKVFDLVPFESLQELYSYCNSFGIDQSSWLTVYAGCLSIYHNCQTKRVAHVDSSVIKQAIADRLLDPCFLKQQEARYTESVFYAAGLQAVVEGGSCHIFDSQMWSLGIARIDSSGCCWYRQVKYPNEFAAGLTMIPAGEVKEAMEIVAAIRLAASNIN